MKFLGVSIADENDASNPAESNTTENNTSTEDNAAEDSTAEDSATKDEEDADRETGPYFDPQTVFKITEGKTAVDRMRVMKKSGRITLVKCETGKGWVVFAGKAYFLHNYFLQQKENTNLAGELFLAGLPEPAAGMPEASATDAPPLQEGAPSLRDGGVLFIRALSGDRRFFGNLAERGNPAPLAASLVLLLIVGFWMVIPPFGRYKPAPEKPGKPLRERFLAEGRFLKKYNALGKYLEIYKRELEQLRRSRGAFAAEPEIRNTDTAHVTREVTLKQFIKEQRALTEQLEALSKSNRGNL